MSWQLPQLPFFDERHRHLATCVSGWCDTNRALLAAGDDPFEARCRRIVASLARSGLLDHVLPEARTDGPAAFDVRSICIIREGLAYESNLAATLFAVQGMGLAPLLRAGSDALGPAYLDRARRGETIGALAISEAQAGSDVAAISASVVPADGSYRLNGTKVWIANGAFADHYLVLARSADAAGAISAFLVDADLPGVVVGPETPMIDGCPLASVRFEDVAVPASHLIGRPGEGMKAVMAGFDIFRPSVGAAATGIARRALKEAVDRVESREIFGQPMSRLDGVQARLADMLADVESGALAVYRAAWTADVVGGRYSTEAALAKLVATEAAQRVIDGAVQLFGALGVSEGTVIERLFREVRPMRIYEGATEIQKKILARGLLGARARA